MGLADATAQPVGASVMAGEAQVLSSGATTVVNQSTSKAIINWQDFSVGQGASVQFNQPNSASVTLNRVTGSGLSTIDGAIRANGQVWLLNPNGVLFGNGARVDVGGLLATTSDIANQDFLGGRYNFSGGGNGEIVNNGQIRAHGGGSVILSAPRVTNRGLISANAGHVVLGGTDTFTVDFNGDHLLSYAIGASTQTGAVTNSGNIEAQGGQILMTARAAAGVQDAVINNTGMAEATSAHEVNGEIILDAGEGTATNAGTLDASGKAAGQTGGTVKILGRLAAVPDNALIDVSGDAGGGTVLIGGNFQGRGAEMHAQATRIGKASINADAVTSGNGGKVAVWSDGRTDFAGSITARGGALGGDGGQVETSGHDLNVPGSAIVSTLAPLGKSGNWLLDPHTIFITTSCLPSSCASTDQSFSSSPQVDANIDPASIDVALRSSNVTLQAATDIVFQNGLTINGAGTAGRTLTLQAGRSIVLGANSLNYAAGDVIMVANDPGGAATGYRDPGSAFISTTGGTITAARLDLTLLSDGVNGSSIGNSANPLIVTGSTPTYIKTQNASAWLTTGAGSVSQFAIGNSANTLGVDMGTGSLNLIVNGVQQLTPISVKNLTISLPSAILSGNPVALTNTGNAITGLLSVAAQGLSTGTASYVDIVNSVGLTVGTVSVIRNTSGNTGAAGTVSIQAQGQNLVLQGNITTESQVKLSAANNIVNFNNQSVITAPLVSLNASAGTVGAADVSSSTAFPITMAGLSGSLFLQASSSASGDVLLKATSGTTTQIGLSGGTFGLKGNNVSLSSVSSISQLTGAAGTVTANTLTMTTTGTSGGINLSSSNNAIGAINLFSNGNILLYDTQNLTVIGVHGAGGSTSAATGFNVQTTGSLTLGVIGPLTGAPTISATGFVTLHAGGSILQGNSNIAVNGSSLSLISDSGTLGTLSAPLAIAGSSLSARTTNNDMFLQANPFGTSTSMIFSGLSTSTGGLIAATNLVGVNAGSGNVQVLGTTTLAINSFTNSIGTFSVTANNLRVTGASINISGATVNSFSANATGDITFADTTSFLINNIYGGGISALGTPGNVTLTAAGSVGQVGQIGVSGAFTASAITGGTPGIILTNNLNAIAGTVSLGAPGAIAFVNTVNTVIGRASGGSQGGLSAQMVDIEVLGAGHTLTLNNTGNVINSNFVTLHSNGSIIESSSNGAIAGLTVGLISDAGSIGAFTRSIILRGTNNLAARAPGDIYLAGVATAVNGVIPITQLGIGSAFNLGPSGDFLTGITAGGNVGLAFGVFDVFGYDTIKANNLFVSGNSIVLNDIVVNTLSARSTAGDIDISSAVSFQINNLVNTNSGISTTGLVNLNSDGGTITQVSGVAGSISAGGLSVFSSAGVTLDNSANAITGLIELGSLGDALLVNSLASHLHLGVVAGTFTLQSGGDLELVAGPSIATLINTQEIELDNVDQLTASTLSQIGGIVVSLRTGGTGIVLSTPGKFTNNFGATALVLPGGARFLIYSADPATDVFGGVKTTGGGIFNISYPTAITATGDRYIFSVASSTNTDFMIPVTVVTPTADTTNTNTNTNTGTAGLTATTNTAAAPALVGFVAALQPAPVQPPPPPPARADVLQIIGAPPPPPPPPPPRPNSPLADLSGPDSANSEPPSASDQATSYVVGSLDGGPPPEVGGSGGGTVIPRYLTTRPNPPTGTLADATQLPAFGNTSLWQ
jgi:filamentous hemagglutinin family protein